MSCCGKKGDDGVREDTVERMEVVSRQPQAVQAKAARSGGTNNPPLGPESGVETKINPLFDEGTDGSDHQQQQQQQQQQHAGSAQPSEIDMKEVPRIMKEEGVDETVAATIAAILRKGPVFKAEAEAAKTAKGGAAAAVLKIAAEQTAAAAGTIFCTVVALRRQWNENGGDEGP